MRALRVAAIATLSASALALPAARSGADEPLPAEVYGTLAAIDPLAGYDWAPDVAAGEVAALAADGAT